MNASSGKHSSPPYPPSWIDRLTDWIERLPGPDWLFYVLGVLLLALIENAVIWADGMLPFPEIDLSLTGLVVYPFYFLAAYRYLGRVSVSALQNFKPLLPADAASLSTLEYRLKVLPRSMGWVAVGLGVSLLLVSPESASDQYYLDRMNTIWPQVYDFLSLSFTLSAFFTLVVRSIRQLRLIAAIQRRAENIDLLDLEPAHAFSALTSRTGIALILLLIYGMIQNPIPQNASDTELAYLILLNLSIGLLAVGVFTVPLIGMRSRLVEAKKAALNEVNALLRLATTRLHAQVHLGDDDGMSHAKTAVEAVVGERERIKKTPTWPWDPGTLRGFASTLLLPVLLWIITRLLERLF